MANAEARAKAVVDRLLHAQPLGNAQPTVAKCDSGPVGKDGGRHVLGPPRRVGSHLLLLGGRGRQDPLRDRLKPRLGERLDP
jgi:hypothetical protein